MNAELLWRLSTTAKLVILRAARAELFDHPDAEEAMKARDYFRDACIDAHLNLDTWPLRRALHEAAMLLKAQVA